MRRGRTGRDYPEISTSARQPPDRKTCNTRTQFELGTKFQLTERSQLQLVLSRVAQLLGSLRVTNRCAIEGRREALQRAGSAGLQERRASRASAQAATRRDLPGYHRRRFRSGTIFLSGTLAGGLTMRGMR